MILNHLRVQRLINLNGPLKGKRKVYMVHGVVYRQEVENKLSLFVASIIYYFAILPELPVGQLPSAVDYAQLRTIWRQRWQTHFTGHYFLLHKGQPVTTVRHTQCRGNTQNISETQRGVKLAVSTTAQQIHILRASLGIYSASPEYITSVFLTC